MPSVTPEILLPPFWPPPRSLATTCGISVDVFSSPYLDVSVQAVPLIYLCVQYMIPCGGFPHSDISGSLLICSSPKLFAAYRVLHRLLMPRHSPCALLRLTSRSTFLKSPLGSLLWLNYAGSSRKFSLWPPLMIHHGRICGSCFRHTLQKSSGIHKVFPAAFVSSDEKIPRSSTRAE